jgi:hypothetical protein
MRQVNAFNQVWTKPSGPMDLAGTMRHLGIYKLTFEGYEMIDQLWIKLDVLTSD